MNPLRISGTPLGSIHFAHVALLQFPVVCFTLALATDIAYWATVNLMWHRFSEWLLLVGLVVGTLATVVGMIDILSRREWHAFPNVWSYILMQLVVLALALVNSLIHAGDGWTAVVPWGIVLSTLTVIAMIMAAWLFALPDRAEVE